MVGNLGHWWMVGHTGGRVSVGILNTWNECNINKFIDMVFKKVLNGKI